MLILNIKHAQRRRNTHLGRGLPGTPARWRAGTGPARESLLVRSLAGRKEGYEAIHVVRL